jgi:N-acetylneuraminic acid mutarotase
MYLFNKILILLVGVAISVYAVPPVLNYAGQVAVNGEAFDGNGLFKFALVNADGTTTYWSNDGTSVEGSEPQASVAVAVNGGLYSILLGNTAQQGMGAIDPAVFAQHTDAKLRVWFSDGVNGFQQLSPDRPFASVPYAFNSESAKTAETANTAMAVQAGAVTSSMLASNAVTSDKLSPQIKADINATIGMNRLSSEVTEKLNQEKTTNNYNAPSVGSLLAVPYGSDAPAGYSLYQRGERKELVWEEKATVSVARNAYDGVEVLGRKIYVVGGYNGSANNIAERYDPETNTLETLNSMSHARHAVASTVLNGKVYAIGGQGLSSVEVYDPSTESWSTGVALPSEVNHGTAITVAGKIYLIGGRNTSGQSINQVLCFDPSLNQWQAKANMPTMRSGHKLVWFENRIWAIGGKDQDGYPLDNLESYDPATDSWQAEASLKTARNHPVAWVANGNIYIGGSFDPYRSSIEVYNQMTSLSNLSGSFPVNIGVADAVVINEKVYVIAGNNGSAYSNKVFAADLNASMEGIYDLYRKDGDAPVGTPVVQSEYADGSVTASKIAKDSVGIWQLNPKVMKYLKPEITVQPQARTVYEDTNVSYSVTAEGKYLTYQWKKDGVDLTGETNATLNITDANATQHDGNYSVVVSNDFGSVESNLTELIVKDAILNGLVGWWKFDEGSGTVAYDSSGNGNHGNLTNGPTWVSGKIGGALSFDGVNDHVRIGNVLNNMSSSCFSLWFKPASVPSGHGYMVFKEHTYALTLASNGGVHLNFGNGSEWGNTNVYTTLLELNKWYNVTATRESGIMKVFIDINLLANNFYNTSFGSNSWPLVFGGIGTNSFNGLIDDIRIYDRALSAEEVLALYNLGQ